MINYVRRLPRSQHFRTASRLQARLNFYNAAQSVLTRLFAVDYAAWYDQLLPSLS